MSHSLSWINFQLTLGRGVLFLFKGFIFCLWILKRVFTLWRMFVSRDYFKKISTLPYMHHFMLPAIAITHVLLKEKALSTCNMVRKTRRPKCGQLHTSFVVSCLLRTSSSHTRHFCSLIARLPLGWQKARATLWSSESMQWAVVWAKKNHLASNWKLW